MTTQEWLDVLAGMDNPAMVAVGEELIKAKAAAESENAKLREALKLLWGHAWGTVIPRTELYNKVEKALSDQSTGAGEKP